MKLHKNVKNKKSIDGFNTLEERCKNIHNNKYNYSKFIYLNSSTKSIIICPIHGEFTQRMNNHLDGQGCYECSKIKRGLKRRSKIEDVIRKANIVHKNKYDYSSYKYLGCDKKSTIVCPEHGEWETIMETHVKGHGCPKCGLIKSAKSRKYKIVDIIKKANFIHNSKYNYSEFKYDSISSESTIICPFHGKFNQSMDYHINGSGCSKCSKRTTDNDSIYFWNIKDTNIYKIGITSNRLRYKRIIRVANEHKVKPIVLAFAKVDNAFNLESRLHKEFNKHQNLITSGDGHTEFMTLKHKEILQILDKIAVEMIDGTLNYPSR